MQHLEDALSIVTARPGAEFASGAFTISNSTMAPIDWSERQRDATGNERHLRSIGHLIRLGLPKPEGGKRFLGQSAPQRQAACLGRGRDLGVNGRILASLEDGRARRLLARLLPRIVSGPAGARLLARILRAAVASGQHQEVFSLAIGQLKVLLAAREENLRGAF